MLLLVGFFVIHMLMILAAGPINELRSIITGWYRIDPTATTHSEERLTMSNFSLTRRRFLIGSSLGGYRPDACRLRRLRLARRFRQLRARCAWKAPTT